LHRVGVLFGALCTAVLAAAAPAGAQSRTEPPTLRPGEERRCVVDADLADDLRSLTGTLRLAWRVPAGPPRTTVPLVVYGNLYRTPNPRLDDVTYPWCFRRTFNGGGTRFGRVETAGGAVCPVTAAPDDGWPEGTLVHITLPSPVRAGGVVRLRIPFITTWPERFGAFGFDDGVLTANGGAVPHLPAFGRGGRVLPGLPPRGRWEMNVTPPAGHELIINGHHFRPIWPVVRLTLPAARWITLVAAPKFHHYTAGAGRHRVDYWRLTPRDDTGAEVVREALRALQFGAAALGTPPQRIVLIDAKLRDVFTRHGDGCTLVSDRMLRVFTLLTKHHHDEVAGEIFYQLCLERIGGHEAPARLPWTAEAAAWWMRGHYRRGLAAGYRDVKSLVEFFSIFAIVDKERVAPRFPFSDLYYDAPFRVDLLREDVTTFAHGTPEGRELAERITDLLGADRAAVCWLRYLGYGGVPQVRRPLHALAASVRPGGDPALIARIFHSWQNDRMPINYLPRSVEQEPAGDGKTRGRITIAREQGPEGLREPIPVEVGLADGTPLRLSFLIDGPLVTDERLYDGPIDNVTVDPDARLLETSRADNGDWFSPKLLFKFPRFNIDVNRGRAEAWAGVSLVASGDYRNRLTLDGFVEQQAQGLSLGLFHSEGWKRDTTDYPFTVGAAVFLWDLDETFAATRSGRVNDDGTLWSLRASVELDLRVDALNPHWGLFATAAVEWSDAWAGSDFRYALAETRWNFTIPLAREHIVGFDFKLGFSDGVQPTQRLFDMGGEFGVRGVRAGNLLGEHVWMMRLEYRHLWLGELDEWVPDDPTGVITPKRLQGVLFVDTGNVADRLVNLFDAEDTQMAAGYGLRFYFEALGARYSSIRFDVAWQLSNTEEKKALFYIGAGQNF
jgi:hypothetical protein